MILPAGHRLGPYEIVSPVGAGGMGEVYKARDTRLDRTVAVKVLAPAAADLEGRARFEREARAVAKLDHPHICGIYDVGHAEGRPYLVMPLLEGQTLAARLARGPLPLAEALAIGAQLAGALHRAHREAIAHRDVKPANVMLTKAGAVLLDFGLAKLRATAGAVSLSTTTDVVAPATGTGTLVGTIPYMAPEQVEGKDADARTDIWALGVVLHEMVTGERPFGGVTSASLIGAILKDEPAAISSRQPLAPTVLDQLVATCLEKDPDARWQSAADVDRQLRWMAENLRTSRATAAPAPRRLGARLAPWLVAAAMLPAGFLLRTQPEEDAGPASPVVFSIEAPPGHTLAGPPASAPTPQFAVSPDGRKIVFLAEREGDTHLWLRDLAETSPRRLEGTHGALDPFWSPDSRQIAYFADNLLKTMDVNVEAPPRVVTPDVVDPRGGTWSHQGVILLAAVAQRGLQRVNADGGRPAPVELVGEASAVRWPHFLPTPDGQSFLFQVRHEDAKVRGVYVGSLGSSSPRRLVGTSWGANYAAGHLLFLDGSTLLAQPFDVWRGELSGTPIALARNVGGSSTGLGAFTVSTTGVLAHARSFATATELRWVDRGGNAIGAVAPAAEYVDFHLSPDGSRLSYSRGDPESQAADVWVLDLARGTNIRLTSHPMTDASAIWSPSGDQIAFRSNRAGGTATELFLISPQPGATEQRRYGAADLRATGRPTSNLVAWDWSIDGRLVLHQPTAETGFDIWAVSAAGDLAPTALLNSAANEVQGVVSPDGRWLAYASDQSGTYEVYVQSFPNGAQKTLVSVNGGVEPRWRGDGRELYYVQPDGMLMRVPIRQGAGFDAAAPVPLFKATISRTVNPYRMNYIPSADGTRFLMRAPVDQSPPSITVVLNWTSLLNQNAK